MQRVFGFLGPNGALPIHLTEYARERLLYNGDRTFGRFLDMLLHRFGLFFYRAWARTQPVVALDRPDDAPIVRHIGSLFGLIEPSTRNRDALGDFPKLFFAGRLARSVRDADGLKAWLTLQFGGPVRGRPVPGALDDARPRGAHPPACATASRRSAVAPCWAGRSGTCSTSSASSWARWPGSASSRCCPDGRPLEQLRALVRQYVGFEFAWDLRLILKRDDVPSWTLGRTRDRRVGRLGRTAWLNGQRFSPHRRCRRTDHERREHPSGRGPSAPAAA